MSARPTHPPSTRRHRERWSVNNPPMNLALATAVYGGIAVPSVILGFAGWLLAHRVTRTWPTWSAA